MLNVLLTSGEHTMKIERLSFLVFPEEKVEDFLKADSEIWDSWLRMRPGFIQKQRTHHPGGRIEIMIFWKSKEDQQNATVHRELPIIDATFRNFMGNSFRLLYSD